MHKEAQAFGFFDDDQESPAQTISIPEHKNNLFDKRFLFFRIGHHTFATPLLFAREVIEPVDFRPIPNAKDYFKGIANIRGEVVGLFDLCLMLNIVRDSQSQKQAIIIFDTPSGAMGVMVDEIQNVINITESQVEFNPIVKTNVPQEFLIGVAKLKNSIVVLLDLKQVISETDLLATKKNNF